MFIYHFNRLIRNKFLWGFFAVIIAIAFVAVDACYQSPMERQAAGTLNGEKVSAQEFSDVVRGLRGYGRNRDNDTPVHVIDRRAWEQIAALQNAEKIGLSTTKSELQQALRGVPAFQGPNGFDMNRYRMTLGEMGMNPETFEKTMIRQLAVMKSLSLAASAGWVSSMELSDELAGMTDRFTVQAATISNSFQNAQIKQEEKDYKKYYQDNKKSYALPDQVQVRYVTVPASNYLDRVSVSEGDIQDFYDSNLDKYMHKTSSNTTETTPLEKVKDEIVAELKLEAAVYTASTSISFEVFGQLEKDTNATVVTDFAKAHKLPVKTSPMFSEDERLYWTENSENFHEAVSEMDMEGIDSRIGVAEGKKSVYLIELLKSVPAHTPKYEEVKSEIKQACLAKARNDAFDKKCKEVREALDKQLAAGKKFADAAKALSLNVSTSVTYTVNNIQNTKFEHNYQVAYGTMSVQKGKISEAIPISASNSLLVYVIDRQRGDALAEQMVSSQLRANLARRSNPKVDEWLKWNLARQKFEPKDPLLPEDADPDKELLEEDEEEAEVKDPEEKK